MINESELSNQQIEKITNFKNSYVLFSLNKSIINDVKRLLLNKKIGGEQFSMSLTGDAGSGKTALINYINEKFRDIDNPYNIISLRVPSKLTILHLVKEMLAQLEALQVKSNIKNESETALTERLVAYLKELNVQLIIINEFQELIEFKSNAERQRIANLLKLISEEAQVPFLFVGMPWSLDIAEDSQWTSRLAVNRELPYFRLSNKESMKQYKEFLRYLSKLLPFEEQLDLSDKQFAFPLFALSRGEIRILKRFLTEVITLALIDNSSKSTIAYFKQAYTNFYPNSDSNLFDQTLEDMKFSEIKAYASYKKNEEGIYHKIERSFLDKIPLSVLIGSKVSN